MREDGRSNRWREIGNALMLVVTLVIGCLVGLAYTKLTQKEEEMTKDQGWWLSALGTIGVIALCRVLDQIGGNIMTSDAIPILGAMQIDLGRLPRAVYVLIEMVFALGAIGGLVYQMKKISEGPAALGWMFGMMALLFLWRLSYPVVWIFAGIGAVSFAFGVRTYRESTEAVWVEFEKGILTGCLLGGSIHYGYMVGCSAVAIAWIVQDRGLWLGALGGALLKRAERP